MPLLLCNKVYSIFCRKSCLLCKTTSLISPTHGGARRSHRTRPFFHSARCEMLVVVVVVVAQPPPLHFPACAIYTDTLPRAIIRAAAYTRISR